VWLPRILVAIALVIGLPFYLRAPIWCDITLYDLAAKNLLDGGVHYRDLFDTNLPGYVWILTGLRWAFGPSDLVVRLADLVIVLVIVFLIDRLVKWGGGSPVSRWWALAGMAFLYPYAIEMVHAQRDMWMALPALAAIALRVRRAGVLAPAAPALPQASAPGAFWQSLLEGVLWGSAVWLKPHIVLVAAGTWVLSCRRLTVGSPQPWRLLAADLAGNVAGGLAVGAAGVLWLVATGTWEHFWAVVTVWNPEYARLTGREFSLRCEQELFWIPPWSLFLIPTVPLALASVLDAGFWCGQRPADPAKPGWLGRWLPAWLWDREASWDARFVRGLLAGLYLVWAGQSFVVQRGFTYVHITETLLMLGVWASHRWLMAAVPLVWLVVTGTLWLIADANPSFREHLLTVAKDKHISAEKDDEHYIARHPLADPDRLRLWPQCLRWDLTEHEEYVLRDRLSRVRDHEAVIGWEELEEVAAFLRKQNVKDREVLAWCDSTHPVYRMLGIKPGIRFMHTFTAEVIGDFGYGQVMTELAAAGGTARFAVGDLETYVLGATPERRRELLGPPASPTDLLPAAYNQDLRNNFPFHQPCVFRTRGGYGRYTVHALTPPLGDREPQE
jgi:hypothetical protein